MNVDNIVDVGEFLAAQAERATVPKKELSLHESDKHLQETCRQNSKSCKNVHRMPRRSAKRFGQAYCRYPCRIVAFMGYSGPPKQIY